MLTTFLPRSMRAGLRAATGHVACAPVTWALVRSGRSTLVTPPLLLRPPPLTERLLLPLVGLLNCNRLSFTQAPPFEQEYHAPSQDHTPCPASRGRAGPRSAPCRAAAPHWLPGFPAPAPGAGFFLSLAGYRFGLRPLSLLPGSHCLRRCLLVQPGVGVVQFLGDTLLFFASRRPASANGILEFRGLFFPP